MSGFNLFTVNNPKTIKGMDKGYVTFLLHLAPASLSGYQTCPKATPGCRAACLNTAGRGGMFRKGETSNVIQRARIRKTKLFFEDRDTFMQLLVVEINKAIVYATKKGFIPVFRLNGTSDIAWEKIRVGKYRNVMELFPDVQFYDYTKIVGRKVPDNYHLTFSAADGNDIDVMRAIRMGMNVAVVFGVKKTQPLPNMYLGREVINGDESDLRFLDPQGKIVGLYAKGKAKADTSGFVKYPVIELRLAA